MQCRKYTLTLCPNINNHHFKFKEKMKKILLTLFSALLALNVAADIRKGTWGSIEWEYNTETRKLTISGSGQMKKSSFSQNYPWAEVVIGTYGIHTFYIIDEVDNIIFTGDITNIPDDCFANAGFLTSVTFTPSITSIGSDAFLNCKNLANVDGYADYINIASDAFKNTGLIDKKNGALYFGTSLIKVYSGYSEKIDFKVKERTTKICDEAFAYNTDINSISFIPSSVTSFGENMFKGCNLTDNNSDDDYLMAGDNVIVKVEDKSKVKYTISGDIKFIAEDAFDDTNPKFIEFEGPTAPQIKTSSLPTDYTTIVEKEHASNFKGFKNVNTTKIELTKDKLTTCTFLHDAVIPDGIAVYRAKVDDGGDVINLYKLNSDNKSISIKKGQGVILKAYSGAQYTFNMANTASDIKGDNDIKGCLDDTYLYGSENAFGIKTIDNKQHFIRINSKTTIPAGKAYIQGSSNTASQVRFQYDNLEEEGAMWETSIEDINAESNSNSRIYNMSGQRLSSAQKGLNIIDGKIVMK